jgi:hypothetical protein
VSEGKLPIAENIQACRKGTTLPERDHPAGSRGLVDPHAALDGFWPLAYDSFTINPSTSMTQLTQEFFEQTLKAAVAPLATAEELRATERRLIKHGTDLQAELARMVATGFDDVQRRLDVVERVHKLETDMRQIKEALHISA